MSKVKVQLLDCSTRNQSSDACAVVLKIRARAPPVHNSSALDCREWNPCELESAVPAWEHWYYVLVERYLTTSDVYFRIGVQVTGEAFAGIPSVLGSVCLSFSAVLLADLFSSGVKHPRGRVFGGTAGLYVRV